MSLQNENIYGKCHIGGLDAWTDDKEIIELFIRTKEYEAIIMPQKYFLCGRRGSGKSAIAKCSYLAGTWDSVKIIRGEQEEYGAYLDLVASLDSRSIDVKRFAQILWRYVLCLIVLQTIVDEAQKLKINKTYRVSEIRKYLKNNNLYGKSIGSVLHDVFKIAMAQDETDSLSSIKRV